MTAQEAQRVLATLLAGYPSATVDEPSALVWADHLRDVPLEAGMTVAHQLIRTSKWFPAVSEFREAWLALRRREASAFPELPPAPRSRVEVGALIGELKRANDEAWARGERLLRDVQDRMEGR